MVKNNICLGAANKLNALFDKMIKFDHQYLWKESINILHFLLGDNHQRKEASKTTTFGQVWLVVLTFQSDSRILWSSISLEEIKQFLRFFASRQPSSESEGSIWYYLFWLGIVASFASCKYDCRILRSSKSQQRIR